jgi:hypothetical protein
VAVDGAALGPLPGSRWLYLLSVDGAGEFSTAEVVDLLAIGLSAGPEAAGEADLARFRQGLDALGDKLRGVSFLAAKKFAGILPRRLFERDVDRLVEGDFGLEYLVVAINEAFDPTADSAKTPPKTFGPREIGPGQYRLDLKEALAQNPDLTSKKILKPFFLSTKFDQLEISCDHAPRWLPEAAAELGLRLISQKEPDGETVILTKVPGSSEF